MKIEKLYCVLICDEHGNENLEDAGSCCCYSPYVFIESKEATSYLNTFLNNQKYYTHLANHKYSIAEFERVK